MHDLRRLRTALTAPAADAARTTGLRLQLSPWHRTTDPGVAAVLHEGSHQPTSSAWETVGLLRTGAGLAVHPPRPPGTRLLATTSPWGDLTPLDLTHDLADTVQQLVQMLLWQRGEDPTWPACPAHGPAHPLRPELDVPPWTPGGVRTVGSPEPDVRWSCPSGSFVVAVGDLAP